MNKILISGADEKLLQIDWDAKQFRVSIVDTELGAYKLVGTVVLTGEQTRRLHSEVAKHAKERNKQIESYAFEKGYKQGVADAKNEE